MQQTFSTTEQPLEVLHISKKSRFSEGREQIITVLENYAEAVRNGNVDVIMSFYEKDIVAFDIMPPLSINNKISFRKNFEETMLKAFTFPVNYTFEQQKIDVSGDLAVVRSFVHFAGDLVNGAGNVDNLMRSTMVLKRIDGNWLITHEHCSVPLDTEKKGMMNLSPDGGNEAYQH